jgi:hypothetical protein
MTSAFARLRRLLPFLVSGVVITLFMAWGLPLILTSKGSSARGEPRLYWLSMPLKPVADERPGAIGIDIGATAASMSTIVVHRGMLSDWYIVQASRIGGTWPTGTVIELQLENAMREVERTPPATVVVAPPPAEATSFARIDTGLSGWPFRAFASESWYRPANLPDGHVPVPETRHCWNLGLVDGQLLLVPMRPLWFGLAGDIVFWSSACWASVAFPLAIRQRRREKYGRCGKCGYAADSHAVKRPELCSECGTPYARDPLGFAHSPEMHFQNAYVWIIFVSSLDIMLTWKILDRGGVEVNPVANAVIEAWGMQGAIAFKFALMMWVIVACEILARLKRSAGRFLAGAAIVISASPVVWSLFLLVVHEFFPE